MKKKIKWFFSKFISCLLLIGIECFMFFNAVVFTVKSFVSVEAVLSFHIAIASPLIFTLLISVVISCLKDEHFYTFLLFFINNYLKLLVVPSIVLLAFCSYNRNNLLSRDEYIKSLEFTWAIIGIAITVFTVSIVFINKSLTKQKTYDIELFKSNKSIILSDFAFSLLDSGNNFLSLTLLSSSVFLAIVSTNTIIFAQDITSINQLFLIFAYSASTNALLCVLFNLISPIKVLIKDKMKADKKIIKLSKKYVKYLKRNESLMAENINLKENSTSIEQEIPDLKKEQTVFTMSNEDK